MKKESIIQFIKFGFVGVSNTLISFIVHSACVLVGMHYIVASAIAFIISVLNAYLLQKLFVFKQDDTREKRVWWKVLLKTCVAYAFTGLFLNWLLLILWIDIIKIELITPPLTALIDKIGITLDNRKVAECVAPVFNLVVSVPINFVINKFWAYRQKKSGKNKE